MPRTRAWQPNLASSGTTALDRKSANPFKTDTGHNLRLKMVWRFMGSLDVFLTRIGTMNLIEL